jgi:hypothetical protein
MRLFFEEEPPDCCPFEGLSFRTDATSTKLFEVDVFVPDLSEGRCLAPTTPTSRFMAPKFLADLEPGEGTWIGSEEEQQSSPEKLFFPDTTVTSLFWMSFPRTA